MANSSKNKKRRKPGFPPAAEKKPAQKSSVDMRPTKRPVRWDLLALFLTITIGGTYLAIAMRPRTQVPRFGFEVLKTYKHDPAAFTQGLQVHGGFLWESTGRNGESSLRKINLETGEILKQMDLEEKYFGEGLTYHDGLLYQLTWKAGKAFVYDLDFNKVGERSYQGEGWGLTSNGTDLILSDGTAYLKFLNPETFEVRRQIRVLRADGYPVGRLNELEYVDYKGGRIYANGYGYDVIYEIEPEKGDVTKLIELGGLWPIRDRPHDAVLNGIAHNPKTDHLLVTGKLCPTIFELRLFLKEE